MKMSIARALKEKNRLAAEIDRLWEIVQSENSCLETHTRTADVRKALQTIELYTSKLVEIKAKIGNANQPEQLRKMNLLDETKNRLAKIAATSGSEDPEIDFRNARRTERTAVFDDEALLAMKRQLQLEANKLQDQLDAYNAVTQIDFETPLK